MTTKIKSIPLSKLGLYIWIFFLILGLTGCKREQKYSAPEPIKTGEELTMYVATDVHYLANELHDDGDAYQKYLNSGDGRLLYYIDEITDAFIDDMNIEKPDVLILSGDLTNNGEKESHTELAKKLNKLEETAGTRVYVIPGNHDIQNPWARSLFGDKQNKVDSIGSDEFDQIYGNLGYNEAISRDENSLSYLAAPSEDLWLLMLDTNIYDTNYKYGVPATNGKIKEETFNWIRECRALAKEKNVQIVTVMHHNLLRHTLVMNYGFTLDNSEEAIKVFEECDLQLVLSGHIHIQDINSTKKEENPIYDVVTSALIAYPVQYGVIKFQKEQGYEYQTKKVDVDRWAKTTDQKDENLLDFKQYARDHYASRSYDRAYNSLVSTGLYSEEEILLMSSTMSLLNVNYFGGSVDTVREEILNSKGYQLWRKAEEPERIVSYINNMLYDDKIENNHLLLPN
ncbi:MAG: metallophosphoesterase [Mobilitalea sp.]